MLNPLSAITWGASQADLNVTYSFFPEGIEVENDGEFYISSNINAFVLNQILSIFETVTQYTNLTFTEAAGITDFEIMLTNDLSGGTDGFMSPPGETNAGLGVFNAAEDFKFETGAYNYMVVVHEVMHGLGLAHPHDDGGGSDILSGVTAEFDDFGAFDLNQGVYTVMTYNNGFPLGDAAPDSGEFGYETGPMALDVAVLQQKYGANATWASSDTAYELVGINGVGTGWKTIWDTGGDDGIFYSGGLNVTIDLRPATLQYQFGGGGFVSSVEGIAGGYTIANGVTIENATGGSGDDILIGTGADDILNGGAGTDRLLGLAGDDTLIGGSGADIFVFTPNSGHDVITDYEANLDLIRFNNVTFGFGGLAIGDDGADLLITTAAGDTIRLLNEAGTVLDADDFLIVPAPGIGTINGDGGNNTLSGGAGGDLINGLGGDDILIGGAGNDTLDGGAGKDRLLGQVGDDILTGGSGRDAFIFTVDGGDDIVTDFEPGQDILRFNSVSFGFSGLAFADAGADLVILRPDGDRITLAGHAGTVLEASDFLFFNSTGGPAVQNGDAGANTLTGGAAPDILNGLDGNDVLIGGGGGDVLNGGAGSDRLLGQGGNDVLTGGDGRDAFVFTINSGDDIITDFARGQDIMRFNGVGFGFGDLAATDDGADLRIETAAGDSITLIGQAGTILSASDFLFA